ncbi:MAG: crossover junction endodeoxyribonuclease RuvC [SAR202 cluster bacterium]|nr:crossover junction endodeoxyribonuclease RuvC [SAR202 cluster bacterium]
MRILGIDPGTHHMGIGLVEDDGGAVRCLHFEVISADSRLPLPERLRDIHARLAAVIEAWKPDAAAVEEPFAAKNIRAAIAVGQAEAVAMLAAAQRNLPITTYAPAQIKRAVTDYGGSSKEQVQEMVRILLVLPQTPTEPDAADALAVALCHHAAYRVQQLTSRARS